MNLYETKIGRTELFVDGEVLEKISGGAALKMHSPELKEIVFTVGKPWEWQCGGPSMAPDGKGGYFLYYRGLGTSRTTHISEFEKNVSCVCHT